MFDLVQGGLKIQCLLIFSSKKRDLLDKVQKLLALSIEKGEKLVKNEMAMVNEIATDKEMVDDTCVIIPAAKKVKVEADCVVKPVEVVEDNATSQPWAAFPTTQVRLYAEEKAILVSGRKLNDKHTYKLCPSLVKSTTSQNGSIKKYASTSPLVSLIK